MIRRFKNYFSLSALLLLFTFANLPAPAQTITKAPEFTQGDASSWINSKPLTIADLKGKVVLLDIWTFGCWNCYRSFPWMNDLEKRFEVKGFTIIGVHTPEFDHEHDRNKVIEKAKEFKLKHPIMMDNDFSYWKALNNQYWPTYYLIDKQGRLRARFFGETHKGDEQARQIEVSIEYLLAE